MPLPPEFEKKKPGVAVVIGVGAPKKAPPFKFDAKKGISEQDTPLIDDEALPPEEAKEVTLLKEASAALSKDPANADLVARIEECLATHEVGGYADEGPAAEPALV